MFSRTTANFDLAAYLKDDKMKNLEAVEQKVKALLAKDRSGHGWEHVGRVYHNAMQICREEKGNEEIVALAALLHECDDYKLFGQECAEKLLNARRIMNECGIGEDIKKQVLEIICNLGYSKYLTGTQKLDANGRIVQDADMLDSLGTTGIIRTVVFNAAKGSGKVFVRSQFPRDNLKKEEYQNKVCDEETAVNHLFEKILKLKNIMYTSAGRKEAGWRHAAVVDFLRAFFREQNCPEWSAYLEEHEARNS